MKAALLVAGLCFLAIAGSAGGAGTQLQRPSLAVTDTRPFEVRGSGFEPGERVQVLLAMNGSQRWQRTVASRAGVFTVTFPVSLGACSRFTMHAFGSKGTRARILPRRPQIDCVSPSGGGSRT
jgi:hypothetical protein